MFAKKHDTIYHECTECRCFVWCESPKQWYHKVTRTPCDDFEQRKEIKMTCKDCIHYKACKFAYLDGFGEFNEEQFGSAGCDEFQDKSRFIELPCAVGDTVYVIRYAPISQKYYIKESIAEVIVSINGHFYLEYNGRKYMFGERAFVNKEEAEKALERSEGK